MSAAPPLLDLARFFPALSTGPASQLPSPALGPVDLSTAAPALVFAAHPDAASPSDLLTEAPVAKYPSLRPTSVAGLLFVASPSLVCYAVKPSHVRVIDVSTTNKTLLKGHTQPVTDMAFGQDQCLATVAMDALCIVWAINLQDPNSSNAGVPLVRLTMPAGHGAQRCKFHPRNSGLLFIAHGPHVSAVALAPFTRPGSSVAGAELSVDMVATLKLQAHTLNVADFSFSEDGSRLITGGEDGQAFVWALPTDAEGGAPRALRALHSLSLSPLQAITGCFFVTNALVILGSASNTEWAVTDVNSGGIVQTLKCEAAQPVNALSLRADLARDQGRAFLSLADMNSPTLAILEIDVGGLFSRAQVLNVGGPVYSLDLKCSSGPTLELNCADASMIHTYSVALAKLFPPNSNRPSSVTSAAAGAAAQQQSVQPILSPRLPNSGAHHQAGSGLPPRQPSPQLREWSSSVATAPSVAVATTSSLSSSADLDLLLQGKMDALFVRLEESARARDEAERLRQMRLLEVMSASLVEVTGAVERTISTKLASPEFINAVAVALAAKLSSQPGGSGDAKGLAKALIPQLDKMAESVAQSTATKMQPALQRALEDQFARYLVPAFQAGCNDLIHQLRETAAVLGGNLADLPSQHQEHLQQQQQRQQQQQQQTGRLGEIEQLRVQIVQAIQRRDVPEALQLALTARDADLLSETCTSLNLRAVIQTSPELVSQVLLISLLQQLALDSKREPEKKIEWLEAVALAIDPQDAGIAPHLTPIAAQARESLMASQALYTSLGKAESTRFRALMHILVSLGSSA